MGAHVSTRLTDSNACALTVLEETFVKRTLMNANPDPVKMGLPAQITSIRIPVLAVVDFLAPTVKSTTRTVLPPLVSMVDHASTVSTITPVSAPMVSLAPTVNYQNLDVTRIHAKTGVYVAIPRMATTPANVLQAGPVIIVKKLLTGAETRHVKTVPVVFKEAPPSNATAKLVGPASFAMSGKSLARPQPSIRGCLALSSFAKMVDTAVT